MAVGRRAVLRGVGCVRWGYPPGLMPGDRGPRTSLEHTVDGFLCFDLVVHRWDIARATGGDERMNSEEVRRIQAEAEGFGDMIRKGTRSPSSRQAKPWPTTNALWEVGISAGH